MTQPLANPYHTVSLMQLFKWWYTEHDTGHTPVNNASTCSCWSLIHHWKHVKTEWTYKRLTFSYIAQNEYLFCFFDVGSLPWPPVCLYKCNSVQKTSCNQLQLVFCQLWPIVNSRQLATALMVNSGNCNWKSSPFQSSPVGLPVFLQSIGLDLKTLLLIPCHCCINHHHSQVFSGPNKGF